MQKIDEEKYLSEKNHFISVVTSPRGAQVYLDGTLHGVSPLEIEDVGAGEHLIRISKPGYDDFNYKMVFTESYTAQLDIQLTSSRFEEYRVVGIAKTRHSVLFTNYQEQENDSFMISLYVDGRNEWKELGETVLGHRIDSLKREFKSKYNPRLKESQVVDLSSLILTKADGTEVKLLRNNSMQFVVYRAKVYDNAARRFVYVDEGSALGDAVVHTITDNELVLRDKAGNSFTLSKH